MMVKYSDILIDIILATMERKGITRVALSKRIGTSSQALGKYLLKRCAMPLDVALAIVSELEIDINKVINLKEDTCDNYLYGTFLEFKDLFEHSTEAYLHLKRKQ